MRRADVLAGAFSASVAFVVLAFATRGWVFGRALGFSVVCAALGFVVGAGLSMAVGAIRGRLDEVRRLERETGLLERYPSLRFVDPSYRHQLADPETFWREVERWRSA